MSFEQTDSLYFEEHEFATRSFPLAEYLQTCTGKHLFVPAWPTNERGYWAIWLVKLDQLYLTKLRIHTNAGWQNSDTVLPLLFPFASGIIHAYWYSGTIRAFAGRVRYLGVPPRRVHDDALILQVVRGAVSTVSIVDNSRLPDPTDDELRQTLPDFLWPERMRTRK